MRRGSAGAESTDLRSAPSFVDAAAGNIIYWTNSLTIGHNVVATVAIECGYHYREEGPEALKPVGETEFLESVGISASNVGLQKPARR
jgi:plastocyanin